MFWVYQQLALLLLLLLVTYVQYWLRVALSRIRCQGCILTQRGSGFVACTFSAGVQKSMPCDVECAEAHDYETFLEERLALVRQTAAEKAHGDVRKLTLTDSVRCWTGVPEELSILCDEVVDNLSRVGSFLLEHVAAQEVALTPPEEPLNLHIHRGALERVSGWVVHKELGNKRVREDTQLMHAVKTLEGMRQPNTNNYVFTSHMLQYQSLHSAGEALMSYMIKLEESCQSSMTSTALYEGRHNAYENTLDKFKGDPELWGIWLAALQSAGLQVVPGDSDEVEQEGDLTYDKARVLQGLVTERYMHMRQNEELERQRVKAVAENQALRESLKVYKASTTGEPTGGFCSGSLFVIK